MNDNYTNDFNGETKPFNKIENQNSIFNIRVKAGSRRTYFFDVKTNKKEDYYIIVTERRRRFDDEKAFDKNKIFLYKEDFNKFVKGLVDTVDYVKTELMPNFDFAVFDRENNTNYDGKEKNNDAPSEEVHDEKPNNEYQKTDHEAVDKKYEDDDKL